MPLPLAVSTAQTQPPPWLNTHLHQSTHTDTDRHHFESALPSHARHPDQSSGTSPIEYRDSRTLSVSGGNAGQVEGPVVSCLFQDVCCRTILWTVTGNAVDDSKPTSAIELCFTAFSHLTRKSGDRITCYYRYQASTRPYGHVLLCARNMIGCVFQQPGVS
jgi:hypothetical protein